MPNNNPLLLTMPRNNPLVQPKRRAPFYVLCVFLVTISFAILSLLKLEPITQNLVQDHNSTIDSPHDVIHNSPQSPEAASSPNDEEVAYSLAKEQSFGYFTDITNENWRIAQRHHASLFPNYLMPILQNSQMVQMTRANMINS